MAKALRVMRLSMVVVWVCAWPGVGNGQTPPATGHEPGRHVDRAAALAAEGRLDDARAAVRAAWEDARSIGAEDRAVQEALIRLGSVAFQCQELRVAHDAWAAVHEVRARTLAANDPALLSVRANLGVVKRSLGDSQAAGALFEAVHDVLRAELTDDDPQLQRARANLANVRSDLGDSQEAHRLFEQVHANLAKTLPTEHADLQLARQNLAAAKAQLGDLTGALALQEEAHAIASRALPDDHPALQFARRNLGATKHALGDLGAALGLLEKACEVYRRTGPEDHPQLQITRLNLANTKKALGDLEGARELEESACAAFGRTLPPEHPHLQRARGNLAVTLKRLGDFAGARKLEEEVLAVFRRTLPEEHVDLLRATGNLATTMAELGEAAQAHELLVEAHASAERILPANHYDLQIARLNLADAKLAVGDVAGSRDLSKQAYAARRATLPGDHPDLQAARLALAQACALKSEIDEAVRLAEEAAGATRRRLGEWALAPRELGGMSDQESEVLDLLLTLAQGFGSLEPQRDLLDDALLVSQALRGVEARAARRWRSARAADRDQAAALQGKLRAAAAEVAMAADAVGNAAEEAPAMRRRLADAVAHKERVQRALGELASSRGQFAEADLPVARLQAALPEGGVAIAIVAYDHGLPSRDREGLVVAEPRLAALVLERDRPVRLIEMGAVPEIEPDIEALRASATRSEARGLRPRADGAPAAEDSFAVARSRLGRAIAAPLQAACSGATTWYLAVDERLELVPLDALPIADETALGEHHRIRPLVSLFDLLEPAAEEADEKGLLLVAGGLDYDRVTAEAWVGMSTDAAAPLRSHAPWSALAGASREAEALEQLFVEVFPGTHRERLRGEQAGKASVTHAAARARFVHLATHGYFAEGEDRDRVVTGLSPLALCGLALSGANLPPDALGRHAGILTAEELLAVDLSRCELVTLSACDTSLGVRRAGQGYASLRAALQGAGARYVLTSLWKVGDEATMELMVDFYRRLWLEKKEPHAALWEAKMAARAKGAAFRDWAGWVLTGR
jgi:CHAT domain-containing protein